MSIIALVGRISSGKDTTAKMMQYYHANKHGKHTNDWGTLEMYLDQKSTSWIKHCENFSGFKIKKFATKLKKTISLFTGCTMEQLEDTDFKENTYYNVTTGEIRHINDLKAKCCGTDIFTYAVVMDNYPENSWITFRVLLQDWGMKLRSSMPQVHINALFCDYTKERPNYGIEQQPVSKSIDEYPNWIISDLRLLNEAEAVKKHNGIIVRLTREVFSDSNHISETQTDSIIPDFTIVNDGTLEQLYIKVTQLLSTL